VTSDGGVLLVRELDGCRSSTESIRGHLKVKVNSKLPA